MLVLYLEYVEVVYMSVMLCDVIYMSFIIYVEYVEVVLICEGQSCGSLRLDYGSVNIYMVSSEMLFVCIYTNSIQSSLLSHTHIFCLSHSNSSSFWLATQVCVVYCVVSFSFWPLLFGRCCFILFALISLLEGYQ